ncbi:MAG: PilZ domain-containing protein [Candidatus Omnitrophica bacterium]|nr:PilZ domain-containing protein [Candidatus Omnitrophota bacterium]
MPTFEYRKLFRANIILRVDYHSLSDPKITGTAFSKNISPTGLNIVMADKLEKNSEVELEIHIEEGKKPIYAKGKIIWQQECPKVSQSKVKYYSCGIQCDYMSSDDAISTSDFVRDIVREQSEGQIREIISKIEKIKGAE